MSPDTWAPPLVTDGSEAPGTATRDDVQNVSQCAGRPAMSSRCKSDTMKE